MEIIVPELGESIVEATVARWLKKEGDAVTVGEPVVELETEKVDLEVGAKVDGILVKIAHPEGEDVQVGEVLGTIEPAAGGAPPPEAPAPERTQSDSGSKAEAQSVPQPAAQPVPADAAGAPAAPTSEGQAATPAKASESAPPSQPPAGDGSAPERATPVAKRLAEEHQLDLAQIPGSGPGDRITKEDVQRFLDLQQATPAGPEAKAGAAALAGSGATVQPAVQPAPAPAQPAPAAPPAPTPAPQPAGPGLPARDGGREERVRMSRRRRTIAARLVEAQQTAAMLTTFNDVDMTAVMEIRKRRKESFQERHGIKLGFMSFFVKATIGALKEFPQLNAEIQGDEIVFKRYYDIGIAIGATEGLVVPVLRDADRMTFAEVEKAIQVYSQKSQGGTLSLEDLRGGTFTITNGGVYGSLLSTPILNPPQVGILGLHRIEERPVAVDGSVVIRPMMYLALSYDHRIVDGREAVQFLVRLKELVQDPESLLLEG